MDDADSWKHIVGQLVSQCETTQRDLGEARLENASLRGRVAELSEALLAAQQEIAEARALSVRLQSETPAEVFADVWSSDVGLAFLEAVRESKSVRVRYPIRTTQLRLSEAARRFAERTPNALAIAKGILKEGRRGG